MNAILINNDSCMQRIGYKIIPLYEGRFYLVLCIRIEACKRIKPLRSYRTLICERLVLDYTTRFPIILIPLQKLGFNCLKVIS